MLSVCHIKWHLLYIAKIFKKLFFSNYKPRWWIPLTYTTPGGGFNIKGKNNSFNFHPILISSKF